MFHDKKFAPRIGGLPLNLSPLDLNRCYPLPPILGCMFSQLPTNVMTIKSLITLNDNNNSYDAKTDDENHTGKFYCWNHNFNVNRHKDTHTESLKKNCFFFKI